VFPSRIHDSPHLGTRQYARILGGWVEDLGLDPAEYGTHSVRRTKATLIYRRTKNLRAVQLLLGHCKLESTVRYLGIEGRRLGNLRTDRDLIAAHCGRPVAKGSTNLGPGGVRYLLRVGRLAASRYSAQLALPAISRCW